jgi:hypothetical protein
MPFGIKKYEVVALFLHSIHLDFFYFFSSMPYDLFLLGFVKFRSLYLVLNDIFHYGKCNLLSLLCYS